MDFSNAKLPELKPLKKSQGQKNFTIEDQLTSLFCDMFSFSDVGGFTFDSTKITFDSTNYSFDMTGGSQKSLAEKMFDANVLGMAHLGSYELVRASINGDGLVLLPGKNEELATRYVYKAWKAKNNQGRGFHFLRTYLQMSYPNASVIEQLAQPKNLPYPVGLIPYISANDLDYYLTSRILIMLDYEAASWQDIDRMSPIIRDIVAARFVVHFGKLITTKPKTYVGCAAILGLTITVYPSA